MHEVRIVLDPRSRFVRRCLSAPHLLHKLLEAMNPQRTRILWRLVGHHLLVRSALPLDWRYLDANHPDLGARTHSPFDPSARDGEVYLCNLLAYARTRPMAGPWRPKRGDEYLDWFELQGLRYGFEVMESAVVRQEPYRVETSSMPLTALPVELVAAIRIRHSEKFRAALEEGVGRLRAFGCGLLMLKPIAVRAG